MTQPEGAELKDLDIETDEKNQTIFAINPTRSLGMLKLLTRLVSTLVNDPEQNRMMVENKDGSIYYIDPALFANARELPSARQRAFITTITGNIREVKRVSVLRTPYQNT